MRKRRYGPHAPGNGRSVSPHGIVGVRTVRCASHRARARLFAHLDRTPQCWVSALERHGPGGVFELNEHELKEALMLPGVTKHRPRDPDNWMHPL